MCFPCVPSFLSTLSFLSFLVSYPPLYPSFCLSFQPCLSSSPYVLPTFCPSFILSFLVFFFSSFFLSFLSFPILSILLMSSILPWIFLSVLLCVLSILPSNLVFPSFLVSLQPFVIHSILPCIFFPFFFRFFPFFLPILSFYLSWCPFLHSFLCPSILPSSQFFLFSYLKLHHFRNICHLPKFLVNFGIFHFENI